MPCLQRHEVIDDPITERGEVFLRTVAMTMAVLEYEGMLKANDTMTPAMLDRILTLVCDDSIPTTRPEVTV